MRFARSVSSQRSSGSFHTGSSSAGHTPATAAQTSTPPSAARRLEQRVDLVLAGEVGLQRGAADLGRERLRALAAVW